MKIIKKMRISGKINLMNLKAVLRMMKGKLGDMECIVIPLEANKLFKGEKGVYLDIVGFEIKEPGESKDTHIVKQSFSKEQREGMSEDELRSLPILGNLRLWSGDGGEPVSSMTVEDETSDLPF